MKIVEVCKIKFIKIFNFIEEIWIIILIFNCRCPKLGTKIVIVLIALSIIYPF